MVATRSSAKAAAQETAADPKAEPAAGDIPTKPEAAQPQEAGLATPRRRSASGSPVRPGTPVETPEKPEDPPRSHAEEEAPAPAAAAADDDRGRAAPQRARARARLWARARKRLAAQGAIRAPALQPAESLGEAELERLLEQELVADVAAELGRLRIEPPAADLFAGIQLDVKPATLKHLKALAKGGEVPTMDQVADFEGTLSAEYPPGLQGVLRGTAPCAKLSRQLLLGSPSLLVRAVRRVKPGGACGCLAGRLTEAPDDSDSEASEAAFTRQQLVIAREDIAGLAEQYGLKYKGPSLLLDMTQSSNDFRFLSDTALRPEEANVGHSFHLLRDAKRGVVLPLAVVRATKPISKGAELVAEIMREAAEGAWAAADEAEEEAAKAQARLEKLRSEGKEGKQLARAEKAAESAAEAADEAAAVAAGAAGDLQDGMIEQLLPSGWRQHTLDVFVWRHAELAAELAGGELEAGAAKELCGARAAALERYYGGGSDSRSSGGSSGSSSSSTSGGGDADALRDLQAALEESLARHPPPATAQALEQLLTLAPGKRFVRCERSELQLEQHSDFGTLEPETVRLLEGLEGEPEPLPTGCRERLDSGAAFPGVHGCEVVARLHRVRLMTPPNCRALSLHAPTSGRQLQDGECAAVYVGRAYETDNLADQESAYLFDVLADAISEASGAQYSGPDLVLDAGGGHWNEAALANCVFGSARQRSLRPEVVWDPAERRPHMALVYEGEGGSQPGQELLLDYTLRSYWTVQAAKARQAHEAYAKLAGEVILSLRRALRQAGAAEAELRRCLAPVDLAGEHQLYRRADT